MPKRRRQPPIQEYLALCLAGALTSNKVPHRFDPTAQEWFKILADLFKTGVYFNPATPLYFDDKRPVDQQEDLLASLESKLREVGISGTTPQMIYVGKTVGAFLTLAASYGWDPDIAEDSLLANTPTVRARSALRAGHHQALERIAQSCVHPDMPRPRF